jgi:hypothetical protein
MNRAPWKRLGASLKLPAVDVIAGATQANFNAIGIGRRVA